MVDIFGWSMTVWTGFAALVAFIYMLLTCITMRCLLEKKCQIIPGGTPEKHKLIYHVETKLHLYHKYFVILATVVIAVHAILGVLASFRIYI